MNMRKNMKRKIPFVMLVLLVAISSIALYYFLRKNPTHSTLSHKNYLVMRGEQTYPIIAQWDCHNGFVNVVNYAVWANGKIVWSTKTDIKSKPEYYQGHVSASELHQLENMLKKNIDMKYNKLMFYPRTIVGHYNAQLYIKIPEYEFSMGNCGFHEDDIEALRQWNLIQECVEQFFPDLSHAILIDPHFGL